MNTYLNATPKSIAPATRTPHEINPRHPYRQILAPSCQKNLRITYLHVSRLSWFLLQQSIAIMSPSSTPDHCLADICLIPIGTGSASVSKEIADVTRLFRAAEAEEGRGVKCVMHSAGTTIDADAIAEGSWDAVMTLIGQAHALLHENGVVRVQSDIRVGTRTDKSQTPQDKIDVVEKRLAGDGS